MSDEEYREGGEEFQAEDENTDLESEDQDIPEPTRKRKRPSKATKDGKTGRFVPDPDAPPRPKKVSMEEAFLERLVDAVTPIEEEAYATRPKGPGHHKSRAEKVCDIIKGCVTLPGESLGQVQSSVDLAMARKPARPRCETVRDILNGMPTPDDSFQDLPPETLVALAGGMDDDEDWVEVRDTEVSRTAYSAFWATWKACCAVGCVPTELFSLRKHLKCREKGEKTSILSSKVCKNLKDLVLGSPCEDNFGLLACFIRLMVANRIDDHRAVPLADHGMPSGGVFAAFEAKMAANGNGDSLRTIYEAVVAAWQPSQLPWESDMIKKIISIKWRPKANGSDLTGQVLEPYEVQTGDLRRLIQAFDEAAGPKGTNRFRAVAEKAATRSDKAHRVPNDMDGLNRIRERSFLLDLCFRERQRLGLPSPPASQAVVANEEASSMERPTTVEALLAQVSRVKTVEGLERFVALYKEIAEGEDEAVEEDEFFGDQGALMFRDEDEDEEEDEEEDDDDDDDGDAPPTGAKSAKRPADASLESASKRLRSAAVEAQQGAEDRAAMEADRAVEEAAEKAAADKVAAEERAAEVKAAEERAVEEVAAKKAAEKAAAHKVAAKKAAEKAAEDRAATEAARAVEEEAAEKATADKVAAEETAVKRAAEVKAAEKAVEQRAAAERASREKAEIEAAKAVKRKATKEMELKEKAAREAKAAQEKSKASQNGKREAAKAVVVTPAPSADETCPAEPRAGDEEPVVDLGIMELIRGTTKSLPQHKVSSSSHPSNFAATQSQTLADTVDWEARAAPSLGAYRRLQPTDKGARGEPLERHLRRKNIDRVSSSLYMQN